MISLRHNGESLPETIGRYLGVTTKQIMRGFTVILMILVGAVFGLQVRRITRNVDSRIS